MRHWGTDKLFFCFLKMQFKLLWSDENENANLGSLIPDYIASHLVNY